MTAFDQLSQYGTTFQVKVIASLLKEKEFLQNVHDVLEKEYWDNPAHQWIVGQILNYFYKYNTVPTLDSLKIEVKKIDNEVLKVSIVEQLREAYKSTYEDKVYVEQEFSNFCKNQQVKKAILEAVELLSSGKYDDIRTIIDSALKAGQSKDIGLDYAKDIESRYRDDPRNPVPTPWDIMNELLAGGLGEGDLGIIFGNPGGGKSWTLVALGAFALICGYNVNHYTLELSQNYIGRRYDAFLTGISVTDIQNHRDKVEEAIKPITGKLVIKEYPMGKATVSTIENHIRKCTDLGQKPDLVIIDYVDLLKSRKKSQERKEEIDDNYMAVKGMAREYKVPVWTVSQVNRAGAKDDIIEGDKAAGSYDKIMIADFAASLSRKRQDKVGGTGRFHIMKNRYGMDGMTYPATVDTTTGHIVIEDKDIDDGVIYNGNSTSTSGSFPGTLFTKEERNSLSKKFYELQGISP